MIKTCARTGTGGQIVASNLRACDIISERDLERVAAQIDKAILEGGDSPATERPSRPTDRPVIPSNPASRAVPAPSVSAEAAGPQITDKHRVDARNAITCIHIGATEEGVASMFACAEYAAINASTASLRAELTLLHESHDALAREVEGLRADKARLDWLEHNLYSCTLTFQRYLASGSRQALDAAMTAQKGQAL